MMRMGDSLSASMRQMSTEPQNYGQSLYLRGKNNEMNKQQKLELERKERELKELEGVTFKPEIKNNPMFRSKRQDGIKTEDLLIFHGKLAEEKKEKLR